MGAMENWGLVTYRDVDLLIDPITASNKQKQRVCSVVCHELAHQWFGNLVTMAWWDDLWLNEGFASWAENWASDVLYPHYQMWDQFVTDHLSKALKLDSLLSSHPIQVPIAHAEEVEQVFDAISYCKGGSVVRMIRAVLGFTAFQQGLSQYMKDHAYGNTETYDLWQAWEQSSGMPVQELMASWTEQMGFPLIRVLEAFWSDDKVVLTCEQSWFLADGSEPPADVAGTLWTIPILTCTAAGTQADITMMREKRVKVTIPLPSGMDGAWIKLNAGQEVPMRVQYTPSLLARFSSQAIPKKQLSPADRVGLISDAYALVKANRMKPEDLIILLASFKGEENCVVWQGLSDALCGLETILSDDEVMYPHFCKFAQSLVLPLVDLVGWDDVKNNSTDGNDATTSKTAGATEPEDHMGPILRGIMISLLSTFCYDDAAVVQEAKSRCQSFLEDPVANAASLPTDMKPSVFGIYLKTGGQAAYDAIKAYYYVAKDNSERKQVLSTLGYTNDAKLKLATMEWSTSGEIKLQDFFYAMGSVGQSGKLGRDIAWQYLQDNFAKIKTMLASASPSLMSAVIVFCAGGYCSIAKADEIDSFFQEHPLPNNTKRIAQLTEAMRANGKFLATLQGSKLIEEEFWNSLNATK
jgi:puromycin-sensitive aminopeptidase